MNHYEAYERAIELLGPDAGAWSPGPGRFLVGRWTRVDELPSGEASTVVLRGRVWAFVVAGAGASWEEAISRASGAA